MSASLEVSFVRLVFTIRLGIKLNAYWAMFVHTWKIYLEFVYLALLQLSLKLLKGMNGR